MVNVYRDMEHILGIEERQKVDNAGRHLTRLQPNSEGKVRVAEGVELQLGEDRHCTVFDNISPASKAPVEARAGNISTAQAPPANETLPMEPSDESVFWSIERRKCIHQGHCYRH